MFRSSLLLIFFICLISLSVSAQQQLQFTQFSLNKYAFNPAYAGLDNSISVTGVYRSQWNGIRGNPKSQHISGHVPLYYLNGAMGLGIQNERYGGLSRTHFNASYSYILDHSFGLLAVAGKLGLSNLRLNGEDILTPEGDYESGINHNDPILDEGAMSGLGLGFGAGIYYLHRYFELGMAYDQISQTIVSLDQANVQMVSHFNMNLELKFRLNNQWAIFPAIHLKTDNNEWQNDLFLLMKYNGSIFGGIGMRGFNERSLDAMTFLVGTNLNKNIKVSYSYDAGLSNLKRANEGSHEILFNYNLNKLIGAGQKQKIIYNPRYL